MLGKTGASWLQGQVDTLEITLVVIARLHSDSYHRCITTLFTFYEKLAVITFETFVLIMIMCFFNAKVKNKISTKFFIGEL